jgi:transposase
MKPISIEKREMIIHAKERGETPETIALWTDVSLGSVYNILALHRETNDISPKPYTGRPSSLTSKQLEDIRLTVAAKNDITLEELIEELDLPIKKSRLSVVLIGMGLSFKKRRSTQQGNNGKMCKKNGKTGKKTNPD